MINQTFSSYSATNPTLELDDSNASLPKFISWRQNWLVLVAAVFLVSVPVFIEAPLVRSLPVFSILMTAFWVWLSVRLMSRPQTHLWGDLLFGFSWTWFTGSIYWGWLRWEPIWHLPIEALGLPFALWCLTKNWGKVGNWFYLGSLFGTVLTDIYFYLVDLMPYWRQIMRISPEGASQILQNALTQVQNPWGQGWAVILAVILAVVGTGSLLNKESHWYAFGGAVLSTILVDSLFLLAAALA
ncbi:DUF3120 domain-containing protein [Cuspidothrix issatschenkoi]|uniref:DUF3120 domain-containing protein n=1 Tax=Cuspidothrix issatschenkoi CHARLIE-1 TaxID=2052836 RepID=A0A2S6CZE3_9CYAN|nr:DUF3120 domain-containing protein [Cuspidothrix issatschenkoi]PPJ65128.1 DUF3120 domain-containing protein [Cuspidothrix issatschenkoi CHARLIE-1]